MWSFSSPDHITSPPFSSPTPVQRISASPKISHSYCVISFRSSSSLPGLLRVHTFHVPIFRKSFAALSLFSPPSPSTLVANFSTQPQFPSLRRGPCIAGRRPSRCVPVYLVVIVHWISFILFIFTGDGICTAPPNPPTLSGLGTSTCGGVTWAKITGSLSHTLIATLKLSNKHAAQLQQELTRAQRRIEQLKMEAQERKEGPNEVEQGAEEQIKRLKETLAATNWKM